MIILLLNIPRFVITTDAIIELQLAKVSKNKVC